MHTIICVFLGILSIGSSFLEASQAAPMREATSQQQDPEDELRAITERFKNAFSFDLAKHIHDAAKRASCLSSISDLTKVTAKQTSNVDGPTDSEELGELYTKLASLCSLVVSLIDMAKHAGAGDNQLKCAALKSFATIHGEATVQAGKAQIVKPGLLDATLIYTVLARLMAIRQSLEPIMPVNVVCETKK